MGRHISWLLSVVVALLLAGCGPFAVGGPDQAGESGIYVVDADGSGMTGLTDGMGMNPAWSPDGRRIAFGGLSEDREAIYVVNADGSDRTELATTKDGARAPAWSPSGERIAFVTVEGGVFVVGTDGSDLIEIARATLPTGGGSGTDAVVVSFPFDWRPAWSPDGARLAIVSGDTAAPQVFVVNADGSGMAQVTDLPGQAFGPAWSPDGEAIAFVATDGAAGVPPRAGGVYTVKPDGSGLTRLADVVPDRLLTPAWSPDGTRLLFTAMEGGGADGLYLVNADGSGLTNLTGPSGQGADPTWAPDGNRIAYATYDDSALTVIAADGSGKTTLAEGERGVLTPEWSPDGTRIVFVNLGPYSD